MTVVQQVRVWDLPTRLFHWLLAALVLFSWWSGEFGGSDWREWHFRSGYAVLTLLMFRVAWGFVGPRYARFASFVPRWPRPHEWFGPMPPSGHSAPGALSIYAMLLGLLLQIATGLFATDDNFSEGPWARFVSDATVAVLTRMHSLNRWLLALLVLTHVAAVIWYELRGEPLIGAMVHGNRATASIAAADDWRVQVRAIAIATLAAVLTWWLVSL
jgi:cytochrome b